MKILLLSGPLAVGKTSVAERLERVHHFKRIRTGQYLSELASKERRPADRAGLQELGDELDKDTNYKWLIDEVAAPLIVLNPSVKYWLLDSVRKNQQVLHFRQRYGKDISHVHLLAPELILRARYERRLEQGGEYMGGTLYDTAIQHPNERASRNLCEIADHIVDVEKLCTRQVTARILEAVSGEN